MKRPLIDINTLLDAVLVRPPHAPAAARVWVAAESRAIEAFVPAHGVTTLYYLLGRARRPPLARQVIGRILEVFGVAAVDRAVLDRALALEWPDFEDAVCAAAAEAGGCDAIVTRDPKGFPSCSLPVLTPEAAAGLLEESPPESVEERRPRAYGVRRGSKRGR